MTAIENTRFDLFWDYIKGYGWFDYTDGLIWLKHDTVLPPNKVHLTTSGQYVHLKDAIDTACVLNKNGKV